jgi:hypothetical protein
MPGFFAQTSSAPLLRSTSTSVPATPITMITLPFPSSFLASHSAKVLPISYWLSFTFDADGVVTVLSKAIIRMPRAAPWEMMPFSAVGEAALI